MASRLLPNRDTWVEFGAYEILVDPRDHVGRQIYVTHDYEPEIGKKLTGLLPMGGTAIDIGAHLGHHSLRLSRKAGDGGRVIMIEPHPENARRIRRTIARNELSNAECKQLAVGGEVGEIQLIEHKAGNTGSSTIALDDGEDVSTVDLTTLDQLFSDLGLDRVDTVKIDVEGAEYDILSSVDDLGDYTKSAVIELHGKDHLTSREMDELLALLEEWGTDLTLEPSESSAAIDNQSNVTATWRA